LGGEDKFLIDGTVHKSMKIRVIGGPGTDTITDNSQVKGASRKTLVYDNKEGNVFALNGESKNRTSYKKPDIEYDRKSFQHNYLGPLVSVQYNPDDGLFLGAGVQYKTYGFQKSPFATRQGLKGNYAFATSGYNVDYKGEFTGALAGLDLEVNLAIKGPNFVDNFFGYGNESAYDQEEQDISFYRARVRRKPTR
jgi:hypothetical protein